MLANDDSSLFIPADRNLIPAATNVDLTEEVIHHSLTFHLILYRSNASMMLSRSFRRVQSIGSVYLSTLEAYVHLSSADNSGASSSNPN